jgi:hypothetical protein
MAERHAIIVRIRDGRASDVLFCDCCPAVTVEVRTYTDSEDAAAQACPLWNLNSGPNESARFIKDEAGVFEVSYFEPDEGD